MLVLVSCSDALAATNALRTLANVLERRQGEDGWNAFCPKWLRLLRCLLTDSIYAAVVDSSADMSDDRVLKVPLPPSPHQAVVVAWDCSHTHTRTCAFLALFTATSHGLTHTNSSVVCRHSH